MRGHTRRPAHYDTDLEKGLGLHNSAQGHLRSQSLPTKPSQHRSDLPFHERPYPRARRMTRTIASSTGYFSDNGASDARPPTVTAMLPPPTVRDKVQSRSASRHTHHLPKRMSQSVPASPSKPPDQFAHMILPPAFSPRPAEGIPPYFPLLAAAPSSVNSVWAKWLLHGKSRPQMGDGMKVGEVRRSAKAEAAHRLGLGLPPPNSAALSPAEESSGRLSRKEAKLAAAAASASGSSAAARAYHMFARRAYEKMGKSISVPSALDPGKAVTDAASPPAVEEKEFPKSTSSPAVLVAEARMHDKAAQLEKTLSQLAHKYQDHSEPPSDADINTTPQLLHDGTPIPTDVPSDTDPNLTTPSDDAPPRPINHAAPPQQASGTFRILRRPAIQTENPTIRLVTDVKEKATDDDDEYAGLLFDWDGMDEHSEDDDDLHDPGKPISPSWSPWRMIINVGGLILTILAFLGVLAALPITSQVLKVWRDRHAPLPNITQVTVSGVENLRWTIIDPDTPKQALQRIGGLDGKTQYNLVFSDEFNQDERTFEAGMDPYWEAVDLWYWGTGDYERYNSQQVTTGGGALRIKLEQRPIGGLNFRSGMLQSWNKLCMNGPVYMEVAVQLPGYANVSGLWPSIFTLGNLGRAGYGATLEGMWPYSYTDCDVGTLTNQTTTDGFPASAATGGDTLYNRKHDTTAISFLPGQKLSACTCPQDDHPGPRLPGDDGQTYAMGRSVPEIDLFEAQVSSSGVLGVSQSVQMAPFNYLYKVSNSTGPAFTIFNNQSTHNGYNGEVTQQSISYVTPTIQGAVQHPASNATSRAPVGALQARPGYAVYAYELSPGPQGYLQWIAGGLPSWRMNAAAFDPDPISAIGRRVFSEEPMSIIMNLAISSAWSQPDWDNLVFPAIMSIDYVRIYAPASVDPNLAVTCDPPTAPTYDYIQRHAVAYNNPNLTIWGGTAEQGGYEQNWPRNSLQPRGCKAPLSKYPGSPIDPIPQAPYVPPNEIGP
ncbi:hypothetical protein OC835_005518 [Tilletia horrida]|nr:hypothetical protein OC835_005518 [Tilletia horrida]